MLRTTEHKHEYEFCRVEIEPGYMTTIANCITCGDITSAEKAKQYMKNMEEFG